MALREEVYSKLSEAQQATEAGDWEEALEALRDVEKKKDLDPNEKAQLYTAYGYFYFAQEKYEESVEAYERVLQEDDLPEAVESSTLYTLAQLWLHLGNYDNAAARLERWLQITPDPGPDPYVLLAQAYYQLERPADAIAPLERAFAVAQERGIEAKENWYVLARALYYETEDYEKLMSSLKFLVAYHPREEYWIHLAAAYGDLGDTRSQLAAYEAAHAQGYLNDGRELLVLSQLLLQAEVPYRAGMILEQGLRNEVIENTAEHWRLLSQAWILARENQKAVEALRAASQLSDDGELDARLAQVLVNLGEWAAAAEASQNALRKGVEEPHELQITLGMALLELGRLEEAKTAFRQAQRSAGGQQAARQWLTYIEKEEERLQKLRRSLQ
jgi:tetratricopeptide (TPR) repeat protein